MQYLRAVATACFLLVPSLLRASPADSTSAPSGRPNSLREGAWALQFSIDSGLNSGGVFCKKHLAGNHALRLGAEFYADSRSGDVSSDTSSVVYENGTQERDQLSVHVELIAQRYAQVTGAAHVFYGIGPFVDYRWYRDETTRSQANDRDVRSYEDETYRVGGEFLVGAEWFASGALSLDIEYEILFGYSSTTREQVSESYDFGGPPRPVQHQKDELSGWFVDAGNYVRFGLGIYF